MGFLVSDVRLSPGLKKVPFSSQKVGWAGEDSGFPNSEEIAKWQSNCCGIACARISTGTKDLNDLKDSIHREMLCIVSVSVGFRGGLPKPGTQEVFAKGGHLVVAYKNSNGELSCHHPSSLDEWNKEDWVLSDDAWKASMSGAYREFFP